MNLNPDHCWSGFLILGPKNDKNIPITSETDDIKCQLLDKPAGKGKTGALRPMSTWLCQIDTISVIERAHHHVFWSRCPDHKKSTFMNCRQR